MLNVVEEGEKGEPNTGDNERPLSVRPLARQRQFASLHCMPCFAPENSAKGVGSVLPVAKLAVLVTRATAVAKKNIQQAIVGAKERLPPVVVGFWLVQLRKAGIGAI